MNPQVIDPATAARLDRLHAVADLLDAKFVIPGTRFRFGLDALVGLLPGIGDTLGLAASAWLVHEAHQMGVPGHLKARMIGNIVLDSVVGAIPLLGDVFDVAFKANRRNLKLIRRHFALD